MHAAASGADVELCGKDADILVGLSVVVVVVDVVVDDVDVDVDDVSVDAAAEDENDVRNRRARVFWDKDGSRVESMDSLVSKKKKEPQLGFLLIRSVLCPSPRSREESR